VDSDTGVGTCVDEAYHWKTPVALSHTLKLTLKRGALVAAANWPITIIQAIADSLFKLLILAPLVGGIFLVALAVGEEPAALISLDPRDLATTIATSLLSRPIVLAAWLASLGVVITGGSLFVFLIKGGAVGVLVRGERAAGPIEQPPLLPDVVATASAFTVDQFIELARTLFPRYARLGLALMGVYLASGAAYVGVLIGSGGEGWLMTGALTVAFVAWITIVNLLYLLLQIAIAADDCSVMSAVPRVSAFLHRERRSVAAVFLVVLALVVGATGASVLAMTALGLIAFVPLFGLTVLPLQLLAWVMRGVVFQYIGLSSIAAYLTLYRDAQTALATDRVAGASRAARRGETGVNAAEVS
jgi:hypothetical protein